MSIVDKRKIVKERKRRFCYCHCPQPKRWREVTQLWVRGGLCGFCSAKHYPSIYDALSTKRSSRKQGHSHGDLLDGLFFWCFA